MKALVAIAVIAAAALAGCVSPGSPVPHADSVAATSGNAGPTLCLDGTAPPCTTRK